MRIHVDFWDGGKGLGVDWYSISSGGAWKGKLEGFAVRLWRWETSGLISFMDLQ